MFEGARQGTLPLLRVNELIQGRESGDVPAFQYDDDVEDPKHDDVASGLPFNPITLVRRHALTSPAVLTTWKSPAVPLRQPRNASRMHMFIAAQRARLHGCAALQKACDALQQVHCCLPKSVLTMEEHKHDRCGTSLPVPAVIL